jgi:hypothetical protein
MVSDLESVSGKNTFLVKGCSTRQFFHRSISLTHKPNEKLGVPFKVCITQIGKKLPFCLDRLAKFSQLLQSLNQILSLQPP